MKVASLPCQIVVENGSQLSLYGGVKCPSVPLSRQLDLYVGLMTPFGSRSGSTRQTAAERP